MISYFIPDMPTANQLLPYLKEIDDNRWYSNFGPLYKELKQRIANECLEGIDASRLTMVSSGTSAIELALKTLDLPTGSKVLTPSFTFPATIQAILNAGLKPVICDVDEHSWLLTPDIAERILQLHDIAAIVPVAAFGMPVCSADWATFKQSTGIPIVVDAAAALLNQTVHNDLIYAFSLHATKPLGAGEGGLVVCPNHNQAIRIQKISNFGFESNRSIYQSGTNAKISEYHCAVGLAQLDRIEGIKHTRQTILSHYQSLFKKYNIDAISQEGIDTYTPASLYILFNQSNSGDLFETLITQNIETRRLYLPLIQDFPAFKDNCLLANLNFKFAQRISTQGLALPFHNHLSFDDIERTVKTLSELPLKLTSKI